MAEETGGTMHQTLYGCYDSRPTATGSIEWIAYHTTGRFWARGFSESELTAQMDAARVVPSSRYSPPEVRQLRREAQEGRDLSAKIAARIAASNDRAKKQAATIFNEMTGGESRERFNESDQPFANRIVSLARR